MTQSAQSVLALDLSFTPLLTDIEPGHNHWLMQLARLWCEEKPNDDVRFILCWGAKGTGKTMLAQALAQETSAVLLTPKSMASDFQAAFNAAYVVVDDIDAFDEPNTSRVFDVFNHLRSHTQSKWWATSSAPPALMNKIRPDLSSRMSWGGVYELLPLHDEDCIKVLQAQANRLGFTLPADAATYLLIRLERNLAVLAAHMSSINQYALSLKKPVNFHLVQQWYKNIYLTP